jgi:hypothetical protein
MAPPSQELEPPINPGRFNSTHTATIGMITDGDRVKTLRRKIDPNEFEYIPDLPALGIETRTRTQLVRELPADAGASGRSTGLRVLSNDYERVLFDCHSAIRDADGLHADESIVSPTRKGVPSSEFLGRPFVLVWGSTLLRIR